jgi:hypothetical protein
MEIDGRVTENTLQQTLVVPVASLALSAVAPLDALQALWACTIVIVVARAAFWIGYRVQPALSRPPGLRRRLISTGE